MVPPCSFPHADLDGQITLESSKHATSIRQAPGRHQASKHPASVQQACGKHPASIRQASGKHMASIRQASGKLPASIRQAYGKHPASIRQASGKHPAIHLALCCFAILFAYNRPFTTINTINCRPTPGGHKCKRSCFENYYSQLFCHSSRLSPVPFNDRPFTTADQINR